MDKMDKKDKMEKMEKMDTWMLFEMSDRKTVVDVKSRKDIVAPRYN
jgi:hypothetical protein